MLGDVIRKYRTELGWKQETLAQKAGISQNYVSSLEKGTRVGTLDVLQKLASALNAPLDELIRASQSSMPPEVAALQAAGVPDKDLQELAAKWEGLTEEDRDLLLTVTRSMWERRQARAAGRSQHKAGNPSQPATD